MASIKILIIIREPNICHVSTGHNNAIKSLKTYLDKYFDVEYYCTKYVKFTVKNKTINYSKNILRYFYEKYYKLDIRRKLLLHKGDYLWHQERKEFALYLSTHKYDIIFFEGLLFHHLLDLVDKKQALCVLDTHDLMHKRTESFKNSGKFYPWNISESRELECLKSYEKVLAIQDADFSYLQKKLPTKGLLVKRPASLSFLPIKTAHNNQLQLCYVASSAEHNIHALEWLFANIWSDELARVCSLNVYGTICAKLGDLKKISGTYNINILGKVDLVSEAFLNSHILINPIQIGSGLKMKNVEAIGYGRGVITTTLGAYGMEACINRSLLVVNDAKDFQNILLDLANNWEKVILMSKLAFEDAVKYFSPDKCFSSLVNWIQHEVRSDSNKLEYWPHRSQRDNG